MKLPTQPEKPIPVWHAPSLRGRIALLTGTVIALLIATLLILVWVLRATQANAVARSQKHLAAVAKSLVEAYETRADQNVSIATADPDAGPPKPPPPPDQPAGVPPPNLRPHPPAMRPRSPQEQMLEQITAKVLQDETGIEGGFFRASDDHLIGYAFPTHEGPGDPKALPARETPDIVNLASAAFTANSPKQDQFYGVHDVVLFMAYPVCEKHACSPGPVGAVWLMQRIPGAEADRKRALLWSAFGFAAVASITVIFAFFVLRQVGRGTDAILNRLSWMESDLEELPRPGDVRLAEFHRVLDGLDRLAASLRIQMERERDLQTRMRQHERLAAIGQLAAGVAHELRNPLATIRLRAQMAQRKTNEDLTSQSTTVILAEVDRLDAIIERLLDFSRPIHLSLSSVDVAALCSAAIERWATRYPAIHFHYSGESSIIAPIDLVRFDQILDNLIENAVHQHLDQRTDEPQVRLHCFQDAGRITLTVSDNAGGFAPAALKNALEPFFTTRAKGTGLGLAITKEIVQAFDGSLELSNDKDGALIKILIPIEVR